MSSSIIAYLKRPSRWRVATWWLGDSRQMMRRSLLRLLAFAHQYRIDPAPLVENLGKEHRGRDGRSLKRLAQRLQEGTLLVDALEQTPDVLSDNEVLAIRYGTQTGTLSETLPWLAQQPVSHASRIHAARVQTIAYATVMTGIVILAAAFLSQLIVPMFQEIDETMGAPGSPAMDIFLAICHAAIDYAPIWILMILVVAFLNWSAPARRFLRRRFAPSWLRGRSSQRAYVLHLLAFTIDAGRPVTAALSTLAKYHHDAHLRRQLLLARNEVEQGASTWPTLAETGFLRDAEARSIATMSPEIRGWSLRQIADLRLDEFRQKREATSTLMGPLTVLFFAAIVVLLALAFIGHLFEWTWNLA